MTRIAILETGAPPPGLAATYGDYPAMFRDLLGDGFDFETFDVRAGEWPDAGAFDAAIITGSSAGVYETDGWIAELLDWIRTAKGRTKLVGVCFGHQAMAQALGGRVEKSDRGWGVGLHRYQVVSTEPWMAPVAMKIAIPASHQDQVVEKPADARVVLRSDFTPFAGLAWGEDAISFQAHPEFTPAFATELTAGRHDRIDPALVARAVDSLKAADDRVTVGQWIHRFVSALGTPAMPDPFGYSGKPLIRKLGLKDFQVLKPVAAPEAYADWIEPMPLGAMVDPAAPQADLVHLFVRDRADLDRGAAPVLAAVRPGGMLWVSWPKKSSPLFRDLTEDGLREVLLPTGWVDVKVCAVNADWSGLKFLKRRS